MEELVNRHASKDISVDIELNDEPEKERRITSWNEKLENAAKNIGDSARGYKLMHIKEAQNMYTKYTYLMIFGIALGPLSGVFSTLDAVINNKSDPSLCITSIILAFLAGIIVTIIKFGKYEETGLANKQAAARYTGIESSVRRQLGLYRPDRVNAVQYMEWLESKFQDLFLSAPLLPERTYYKFNKVASELGAVIPKNYEETIVINSNYESEKIQEIAERREIEVNVEGSDKVSEVRESSITETDTENKEIQRSKGISTFPELNQYSDKMLEYELKRMMGFNN